MKHPFEQRTQREFLMILTIVLVAISILTLALSAHGSNCHQKYIGEEQLTIPEVRFFY